ncbi:MAG: LysM peptidoglycan-binding domain-containing protein, partial [Desulfobacterales bacterium]|nr:LysM peptidoglycan-binding domain-containing protein [Desulfobacterales bacterium]
VRNRKSIPVITSILLFFLLTVSSAWGQDAPQQFDTEEDIGFYYTIQKGDTLWDLSQKFYNSQWDWPGLWEMNKDIKNPHWIYPGNTIRVFLKPEFRKKIKKQVKPEKIPEVVVKTTFNYPAIDKIGFIKENEEPSLGTIIREQDGNIMMSADDIIYITPTGNGPMTPGDKYQIFTTSEIKERIGDKRYKGIKHLIKADIEILESNDRYAKAKIGNSYRDATVGDKIMAFYKRDSMLEADENPAPIDAVILCSEDDTVMINDKRIAFINKGEPDQIKPGQIYKIFQTQEKKSVHDGEASVDLDPLESGKLIVLHTEETSATVLVISSKRDIHPGDMVN